MNWYLVKLVYRITCGKGNHPAQFDEQLRLVHAEDDLHAYHKAQLIGEKEQVGYNEGCKPPVTWKFLHVTELHKLKTSAEGAEVYSHILEVADGENYQHGVQLKSGYLFEQCTEQFLASI